MRIGTITNWAYGVTLLLTGVSGAFIVPALLEAKTRGRNLVIAVSNVEPMKSVAA